MHAGALLAIEESGVKVRRLVGTSGGAVAGSLWLCGVDAKQLRILALDTDFTRHASLSPWRAGLAVVRGYMNSASGPKAELRRYLCDRTFADLPHFKCVSSDLSTSREIICDASRTPALRLVDGVYGSMAIPVLFEPERLQGGFAVDGGVRINFGLALLDGSLPILGVRLGPPRKKLSHITPVYRVLSRVIDTVRDSLDDRQLELRPNATAVEVDPQGLEALDFRLSRDDRRRLIEVGYEATSRGLQEMLVRQA